MWPTVYFIDPPRYSDRQTGGAKAYYMEAGNVGIDLAVDTGSEDAILIQPNQTTPLNIGVTNTGTRDCYVFVKTVIP